MWMGQGFISWPLLLGDISYENEEDESNKIFDELVERGFIEPIYQNCSLVPDSCRMSRHVRYSLYKHAKADAFTLNDTPDLDLGFVPGGVYGNSGLIEVIYSNACLINVGDAIIDSGPEIFKNKERVRSVYLGRWQSSATHHIELADIKILHELKKLYILRLWDFDDLEKIEGLQKLTISWGGCSLHGESRGQRQEEASMELLKRGPQTFPLGLQKLDLQCFPIEGLIDWLRPAEIQGLKKLYIRGGELCDSIASTSSEPPPLSPRETPTIDDSTKTKSNFSIRSYLVANFKAKVCVSKPKPVENSHRHHNAASRSETTKRNDHHGEDLPTSSEVIPNDLLLFDSALKSYKDHMTVQINLARKKFKELQQNSGSSERDFEELRKAIAKLKLQIPTPVNILSTTNKDDHHGGAALSPSSKLMHNDLLLVDS
ncbi:hypothetical protein RHMOL_Rhmol03G0021400 [Rhododendron molle]|uniref:Uncharacterized protein n=1 Tax=Rhododendron molle TaxID=49168 RepID=A0ACC0P994_RHOML|nr:hypothetical protein RHMOL_Rhmol03G0021400 [Rhododendron molle]